MIKLLYFLQLQNEEEEEAVPLAPEPVELQPVVEAPAATAEASAATAATWMDNGEEGRREPFHKL